MRDIKFRGKTKDGSWRYGGIHINDEGKAFVIIGSYPDKSVGWCFTEVDPETIGQFTGRKIEEKDLYGGDIVYITIFDCFGGDKQYLCRVEWWGSAFWLVSVKNEEDRWDLDWALSQDDEPEILGNIHENPELLNAVDPDK